MKVKLTHLDKVTALIIPHHKSTTKNGTHGGGVEYTDGVTVFGQPALAAMLNLKFVVRITLYYYCTTHRMGGQINTLT